jgi:hypothetical protein
MARPRLEAPHTGEVDDNGECVKSALPPALCAGCRGAVEVQDRDPAYRSAPRRDRTGWGDLTDGQV